MSPSLSLSKIADLLETKRRVTIFRIYFSVSCLIPNCFLTEKNQSAFDFIYSRSIPILSQFTDDCNHLRPIYSILPDPLLSIQPLAKHLYPWTTHEYQYNINSRRLWWPKYTLSALVHLCLVGLKPQELVLANAEFESTQVTLQNIDEIVKAETVNNQMKIVLRRREVYKNYKSM